MRGASLLLLCLAVPAGDSEPASGLAPPVRLEADGKPIDVFGGHAAPAPCDFDGDGVRDLLVGQFLGDGRILSQATMRLYRNEGTDTSPRFGEFRRLEGGGDRAWVPTG